MKLFSFFKRQPPPPPKPIIDPDTPSEPPLVTLLRTLIIVYDPVVDSASGKRLSEFMKWNKVEDLAKGFMSDILLVSGELVRYQIVERFDVSAFPAKVDGHTYEAQEYLNVVRGMSRPYMPQEANYYAIIERFNILGRVAKEEIDEVWIFNFPHAGFYESIMGGPGAFWCNAPPLKNTEASKRRFIIMGFSYERGVGEMLENMGHRAESIMEKTFERVPENKIPLDGVYGSSHDDIGQDWSGYGLPDGREGVFSHFDSYTSLLAGAIDAGTGISSVLGWDGLGWHELVRAYAANKRIRMVKVQPCEGTRNRMWFDMGGDLVFQEMPYKKGSPRLDSGVRYQHEAVIESAAIDMGTASGLPKFIKELTVFCENLGDGNEIRVDCQVDDDVHTSNCTNATTLFESPESVAFLGLNNVRKFAYRLRILSSDNTSPVDVLGVTPNGYARTPYKMIWTLRCRADNVLAQGKLVKPDVLMRWLLDNARFPGRIEMHSQFELADKFFVIVHPPRMFPYKAASAGQAEESMFTIVLEEAL